MNRQTCLPGRFYVKLLVTFHSFLCLAWNIEKDDASRAALEMSSFNLECCFRFDCAEELIKVTLIFFGNQSPRPNFDQNESAIVT